MMPAAVAYLIRGQSLHSTEAVLDKNEEQIPGWRGMLRPHDVTQTTTPVGQMQAVNRNAHLRQGLNI